MKLAGKYEVLDLLTIGAAQVFRGRSLGSGSPVVVHLFQASAGGVTGASPSSAIVAALRDLNPAFSGTVLDVGVDAGSGCAFVITEVAASPAMHESPKPSPIALNPQTSGGGEFTRLFQVSGSAAAAKVDAHPDPSEGQSAKFAIAPKPESHAGKKDGISFTDMFGAPLTATPEEPVPLHTREAGEKPPSNTQNQGVAGKSHVGDVPPHAEASTSPKKEKSFTDMFEQPTGTRTEEPRSHSAETVGPSPYSRTTRPGELPSFTGVFGPAPVQHMEPKPAEPAPSPKAAAARPAVEPAASSEPSPPEAEPTAMFESPKKRKPVSQDSEPTLGPTTGKTPAKSDSASRPILTFQSKLPLPDRDTGQTTPPAKTPAGGDYSDLFAGLDATGPKPVPTAAPPAAAKPDTGSFTKLFGSPVKPSELEAPSPSPSPVKEEAGSFTQLFASPVKPASENDPFRSVSSPTPQGNVGGSFTQLFDTPTASRGEDPFSSAVEPKSDGFTKIFGSTPKAHELEPDPAPSGRKPGRFTDMFEAVGAPSAEKPKEEFSSTNFGGQPQRPAAPPPPVPRRDLVPERPARLADDEGANATRLFQSPAAPVQSPPPAVGPSEFTRVIKGSEIAAARKVLEGGSVPAAGSPAAPSPFAPPPVPGFPPPAVPSVPAVAAPKAPAIAVPKAPAAPKLPAVEPKKVSYMPLIIIFNVLFVLAVVLILYFALKK